MLHVHIQVKLQLHVHVHVQWTLYCKYMYLEYSCNKYNNLIGQLEVHYFTYGPRGLLSGLVQWSLRSLETLRPEVAPSLRSGRYSLGPSGL